MNQPRIQSELQRPRDWFTAEEKADNLDLYIYDVIGPEWWEEGERTIDLVKKIASSKAKAVSVHLNSPGGLVFDGMAIYNALRDKGVPITTVVDGLAASAASIIFAAGDTRLMASGSMLMVHNAWGVAVGDYNEMTKASERLAKANEQMVGIYAAQGLTAEEWREFMAAETYFDADEAVETGLATQKAEGMKVAACAWDLGILPGVPDKFIRMQKARQKRDKERGLRDGGLSSAAAKKAIADAQREAEDTREIAEALKRNIGILKQ